MEQGKNSNAEFTEVRDNANSSCALDYEVKQVNGLFEVALPFRNLVAQGATEKEAIGVMIRIYEDLLSRTRVDSGDSNECAYRPIQNAMNLLLIDLQRLLKAREVVELNGLSACNSAIDTVATAITALCRINEP